MNIARQIAAHAPLAVSGAKRMVNYARDHSTADGLTTLRRGTPPCSTVKLFVIPLWRRPKAKSLNTRTYWQSKKQPVSDLFLIEPTRLRDCLRALTWLCTLAFVGAACAVDGQSKDQAGGISLHRRGRFISVLLPLMPMPILKSRASPRCTWVPMVYQKLLSKRCAGGLGCGRNGCGCRSATRNEEGFAEARRIADEKLAAAIALTESQISPFSWLQAVTH